MIISMCKVLCVTNRALCGEDFLTRIAAVAAAGADGMILREKDLPETEYAALAESVREICRRRGVSCILHSFPQTAAALHADFLHLPLPVLRALSADARAALPAFGVSCHSVQDAQEAETAGAAYLIAGHIFATDCKKGVPARGLSFLREVCSSVSVPVYAIGGITPDNAAEVISAGAAGVCVMSGLMQCEDPAACLRALRGGMQRAV